MEEEKTIVLTISDLVQRARPLTAASSLVPSRTISILRTHKNPDNNHRQKHSFRTCQDPNAKTLKPLNQPTLLTGTLTLPSFSVRDSPIKCNCFQFSNDSATICCDVLDFDPKMIDRKIQLRAWNFIPLKCGNRGVNGGFLEIISWDFFEACGENVCYLSDFSSFCLTLGACEAKDGSKTSGLIFGVIESISPVTVVPCATGETGSRNVSGFLVNVLVCQCKFCSSKFLSELKDMTEETIKCHCFIKKVIVYFCGLTSLWYPVVSRFIGSIVLLTGLKRKLVFISNEESQLMHVTTDEVSLHIAKLFKGRGLIHDTHIRGKGECGSYTGVITGFYMQGMVVELDEDVVLLLTDQHLTVPHSVRVGAIVTLKNVHFVDPKFRWGKMLILGACCITSVYVESFSPLETGCHLKLHSQSLLQKFIDSLSFAARLWALLVVSCFRKKFAGILSEKEILGSKHKEGLAQKYASSHLPLSVFQRRQGVLLEFCKHNWCCGAKEAHYGHLRLVLPIANLINYCEASWKNILDDQKNFSDFLGCTTSRKPLSCGGRSYMQSIRRVLRTEEICVIVLGTLKMSSSSGRLQLVDATGGVDIMLDLPATWDFDRIFEVAKDFRLIMEGMPPKLADLDSTIYRPLSCRSIFSNVLPLTRMKISTYLYHFMNTVTSGHLKDSLEMFTRHEKHLTHKRKTLVQNIHVFLVAANYQGRRYYWNLVLITFANMSNIPWQCPFEEEPDVHDHVGPVINASMQSSRTSCSDYPLPEGNLITLRGLVVALHDCSGDAFPAQHKPIIGEGYLPMFLEGNGGVCVHVLVDNRTVRIFCDLSKQTYPVGLGRDAYATFHRILVLSGQNNYSLYQNIDFLLHTLVKFQSEFLFSTSITKPSKELHSLHLVEESKVISRSSLSAGDQRNSTKQKKPQLVFSLSPSLAINEYKTSVPPPSTSTHIKTQLAFSHCVTRDEGDEIKIDKGDVCDAMVQEVEDVVIILGAARENDVINITTQKTSNTMVQEAEVLRLNVVTILGAARENDEIRITTQKTSNTMVQEAEDVVTILGAARNVIPIFCHFSFSSIAFLVKDENEFDDIHQLYCRHARAFGFSANVTRTGLKLDEMGRLSNNAIRTLKQNIMIYDISLPSDGGCYHRVVYDCLNMLINCSFMKGGRARIKGHFQKNKKKKSSDTTSSHPSKEFGSKTPNPRLFYIEFFSFKLDQGAVRCVAWGTLHRVRTLKRLKNRRFKVEPSLSYLEGFVIKSKELKQVGEKHLKVKRMNKTNPTKKMRDNRYRKEGNDLKISKSDFGKRIFKKYPSQADLNNVNYSCMNLETPSNLLKLIMIMALIDGNLLESKHLAIGWNRIECQGTWYMDIGHSRHMTEETRKIYQNSRKSRCKSHIWRK
ncbi:hypothetical protein DH2020_027222 [Rehmannia glutinosa]|uniref:CST complex subunit CTC1 n=1 Tax=Rehmannia glutinosa TaxID=99300 RepID=A0ABR0VXK3_REHGL